ncbi:hypothetical protein NODU109028_01515 [Nocardioides dubius]
MRTVALAVAALLLAACGVVGQPDQASWRESALQTVEDTSAALATTRTVVLELRKDHLPERYAITVLATKEEGLATTEGGLSSLQPPDAERVRSERLLALVGRASDAQRQVRTLVVAGQEVPGWLLDELDGLIRLLDRTAEELS